MSLSPRGRVSVRWCAMLAMALDGLGVAMTKASQTFLIEQALCRAFYTVKDPSIIDPDGHVPEAQCKTESLQSQVAVFAATLDFSLLIVGFLTSPIYTRLAALVGKRNVLLLNTTSYVLRMVWYSAVFYFHNTITNPRWVLLSCVFDLFGGGIPVREILLYLYVAESVPEDGMTGTFNLLTAILIGTMSLGTFTGANLLNVNVFITCILIIGVYALLVPLVALFPRHIEPLPSRNSDIDDASMDERRSLRPDDESAAGVSADSSSTDSSLLSGVVVSRATPAPTMFHSLLRAATVDLYLSAELLIQTMRHPFTRRVMTLYFGTTLAMCIGLTTPQWASGSFHTRISNVDQVTAMEQIVSALTLLILPLLSRYVLRPRLHTKAAVDYWIIVASMLASITGALVIAVAPSLTVYAGGVAIAAMGMGLSDALRSFATSALSNKELLERLYVSIRTVQTLAAIVATPIWSGFFVWIIHHPNVPRGLLYLANACVVLICLSLAVSLRRLK